LYNLGKIIYNINKEREIMNSEFKKIVNDILKETKHSREKLDALDEKLKKGNIDYIEDAKIATGHGNFILKRYKKVKALKKSKDDEKYLDLKLKTKDDEKFVATSANREASAYVGELRLLRDILEGYVEATNNIMSVCRLERKDKESEKQISAQL
jgi:hypothetical protein